MAVCDLSEIFLFGLNDEELLPVHVHLVVDARHIHPLQGQ
jgi:hypothetical protein